MAVVGVAKGLAISPYPRGGADAFFNNQKRMFTRPKTRMLASTAPSYPPVATISYQNLPFQAPMADPAQEFNPIREGRQMSQLVEESSEVNSFQ